MSEAAKKPGGSALDARGGRQATAEELRRHLPWAPPPFLEGAVENAGLTEQEMLLLLRNRAATPRLLSRIGRDRRWAGLYAVKRALALHPRTPLDLGRTLVPHLFWKDLNDLSANLAVHPLLRRQAEKLLRQRLEELAQGERIALARRATRALIPALCESAEEPVLRALLGNERLVELDVARVASDPGKPPGVLAAIADHPKWGRRRAVRLAVLENPRTPVASALRLVRALSASDLHRMAGDDKVPTIVRVAADRRLARPPRQRSSEV